MRFRFSPRTYEKIVSYVSIWHMHCIVDVNISI